MLRGVENGDERDVAGRDAAMANLGLERTPAAMEQTGVPKVAKEGVRKYVDLDRALTYALILAKRHRSECFCKYFRLSLCAFLFPVQEHSFDKHSRGMRSHIADYDSVAGQNQE